MVDVIFLQVLRMKEKWTYEQLQSCYCCYFLVNKLECDLLPNFNWMKSRSKESHIPTQIEINSSQQRANIDQRQVRTSVKRRDQ